MTSGGPLLTKTLLFYSQAQRDLDLKLSKTEFYVRAFDKATGETRWEYKLDLPPHGAPMTYQVNGKQFIVLAVGGGQDAAQLVAFSLPSRRSP